MGFNSGLKGLTMNLIASCVIFRLISIGFSDSIHRHLLFFVRRKEKYEPYLFSELEWLICKHISTHTHSNGQVHFSDEFIVMFGIDDYFIRKFFVCMYLQVTLQYWHTHTRFTLFRKFMKPNSPSERLSLSLSASSFYYDYLSRAEKNSVRRVRIHAEYSM